MKTRVSGHDRRRALASGVMGSLALSLTEPLERALVGREPVWAARRIAARLAARAGVPLGRAGASWAGRLLQWTYAPGLAVLRGLAFGRDRRPRASRALALAAAIYGFELVALPAMGATPPLRRWRPGELAALAAHVLSFAVTVELTA